MSPMALQSLSIERISLALRWALSFENAISIGLKSGEYGGRNNIQAPRSLRNSAALGLLCDDRLSAMTTSPFDIVGASWVSTYLSKISLFMAPSITHGAVSPKHRKPAINVSVFQCPKGANAFNRSPIGALP